MDKKIIFGSIGSIVKYLGILMIVPLGVAIWYRESFIIIIYTWLIPLVITTSFGLILEKAGIKGIIKSIILYIVLLNLCL